MKILFVKLSSLGDIIHSYPAIYDIAQNYPYAKLHWLAEQSFYDLANLPKAVSKVHKVRLREFKEQKKPWDAFKHIKDLREQLKAEQYDVVIDAQGLIKSGLLTRKIGSKNYGYDRRSARDSNASFFYDQKVTVEKNMHALERIRILSAKALGYSIEGKKFNYGLSRSVYQPKGELVLNKNNIMVPFVFMFHGTTWPTKHWPFTHWVQLAELLRQKNIKALVSYGNQAEKERAYALSKASDNIVILPKLPLLDVVAVLSCAKAFVSVDTGLGHLAAALDLPGVALYGPTSPEKVGLLGHNQISITGHEQGEPWYNKEFKAGFDSMGNINAHQVFEALNFSV